VSLQSEPSYIITRDLLRVFSSVHYLGALDHNSTAFIDYRHGRPFSRQCLLKIPTTNLRAKVQ
jgi:hypothetical protein